MGDGNFNRKQCLRALRALGFTLSNKRSGSHDKLVPPPDYVDAIPVGQPRFIMVPRHRELHCQQEILSELRGIGGEALLNAFKDRL